MAQRESVRLPNRQERFARALAVLIMGVGILLIGVAVIFRTPSQPTPAQLANNATPPQATSPVVMATAQAASPAATEPVTDKAEAVPEETPLTEPAANADAEPVSMDEQTPQTVTEPEPTDQPEPVTVVASKPQEAVIASTAAPEPAPPTSLVEETPPAPLTVAQAVVTDVESVAAPTPASEPEPAQAPESVPEPLTTETEPETLPVDSTEGWIYAGQFIDGQWLEQGLVIGNQLPSNGQNYALNWGANIRATPPGKNTSLSKTIGYLPKGKQVQITEVKKSGNKGHIWLKIKR